MVHIKSNGIIINKELIDGTHNIRGSHRSDDADNASMELALFSGLAGMA